MKTNHAPSRFLCLMAGIIFFICSNSDLVLGKAFDSLNKDSIRNIGNLIPSEFTINNKAFVTFTLSKTSQVNIKILDADGRKVADLLDKMVPAGTFQLRVDTKKLKKGMYYCEFLTDEKNPMKKVIVVK